VRRGALARDADARRIVSSLLENSRTFALFPAALLPVPPLCLELGALPIRPFYNT
jgi:hypothetical protein